jgi:DNA-binding MarR family transcriptional regulator
MNPYEVVRLAPEELSSFFCSSLIQKDVADLHDAFAELESRFLRVSTDVGGSREFLTAYLPLSGLPEVRAFHIRDPLVECVARMEYLLDLAGDRARAITGEAVLRQIVESRERGFDLIRKLAEAPDEGITAGDLANAMRISPQNLSPLLTDFHASGVIHREKRGKSVFVTLTPEGRALLDAPDPAPLAIVENRFLKAPMKQPRREVSPRKAA